MFGRSTDPLEIPPSIPTDEVIWRGRFFDFGIIAAAVIIAAGLVPMLIVILATMFVPSVPSTGQIATTGQSTIIGWLSDAPISFGAALFAAVMILPIIYVSRTRYQLTREFWTECRGNNMRVWPVSDVTHAVARPLFGNVSQVVLFSRDDTGLTHWKSTATGRFDLDQLSTALSSVGISLKWGREQHRGGTPLIFAANETTTWRGRRALSNNNKLMLALFLMFAVTVAVSIHWLISLLTWQPDGYVDGNTGVHMMPPPALVIGSRALFGSYFFFLFMVPILGLGSASLRPMKKSLDRFFGKMIVTNQRIIITDMFRRRIVRQILLRDVIDVGLYQSDDRLGFFTVSVPPDIFANIHPGSDQPPQDEASKELSTFYVDQVKDSEAAYQAIMQGVRP